MLWLVSWSKEDGKHIEQSPIKKRIPIRTECSQDWCTQIFKNSKKQNQNVVKEHVLLNKLLKKSQKHIMNNSVSLLKSSGRNMSLKETFQDNRKNELRKRIAKIKTKTLHIWWPHFLKFLKHKHTHTQIKKKLYKNCLYHVLIWHFRIRKKSCRYSVRQSEKKTEKISNWPQTSLQ